MAASSDSAVRESCSQEVSLLDHLPPQNVVNGCLSEESVQSEDKHWHSLPTEERNKVIPAADRPMRQLSERQAAKVLTAALCLEWFRQGVYGEIIGPTLPFLKMQIRSEYAAVTQALTGYSVGLAAGCIIGMIAEPRWRRSSMCVIALCIFNSACWIAAIPFATHVALYWVSFFMLGSMQGAIHTFGNPLLLRLWPRDKAAGPMQLLYFGIGVGALIVPQITSLFLSAKTLKEQTGSTDVQFVNGSCVRLANSSSHVNYKSNYSSVGIMEHNQYSNLTTGALQENLADWSLAPYVYITCAAFGGLCASIFVALFLAERQGYLGAINTHGVARVVQFSFTCFSNIHAKTIVLLILLSVFCLMLAGTNRTFASFIFVYAKEVLCFEDSKAFNFNTAFWGAFSCGRLAGFFIGSRVHPKYLLHAEVILMAVCCAILGYFEGLYEAVTWVFTISSGLFLGPAYATLITWTTRYVTVTSMTFTLFITSSSAGMAASQALIGEFLARHSANVVTHFASAQTAIMIMLAAAMQAVGCWIGELPPCNGVARNSDIDLQNVQQAEGQQLNQEDEELEQRT